MKTKRYVGEKVRLLRSRHPALKFDLLNMICGGKVGYVEAVTATDVLVRVGERQLVCNPKMLRKAQACRPDP